LPLERPRRRPIVMPNGETDPKWLQYFDNLDGDQGTSDSFETEARFNAGESTALTGQVRRLAAKQRETLHLPVPMQDRRVAQLQAQVRAIKFLEQ